MYRQICCVSYKKYWIHNVYWYVGSRMYILWNDCWPPIISRTRTQWSIRANFQNSRFDIIVRETLSHLLFQVHQIIEIGQLLWTILHRNQKVFLKWNQNWKIILVKIGQWRRLDWTFMAEIYFHLCYDITIALEYLLDVQWNITYSRYFRQTWNWTVFIGHFWSIIGHFRPSSKIFLGSWKISSPAEWSRKYIFTT